MSTTKMKIYLCSVWFIKNLLGVTISITTTRLQIKKLISTLFELTYQMKQLTHKLRSESLNICIIEIWLSEQLT